LYQKYFNILYHEYSSTGRVITAQINFSFGT